MGEREGPERGYFRACCLPVAAPAGLVLLLCLAPSWWRALHYPPTYAQPDPAQYLPSESELASLRDPGGPGDLAYVPPSRPALPAGPAPGAVDVQIPEIDLFCSRHDLLLLRDALWALPGHGEGMQGSGMVAWGVGLGVLRPDHLPRGNTQGPYPPTVGLIDIERPPPGSEEERTGRSTELIVGRRGLWAWLRIHPAASRSAIEGALQDVRALLASCHAALGEVEQYGYARSLMDAGSVERGGVPHLEISDGMQPGIYRFDAWVNPGEPGIGYVRAWLAGKQVPLSVAKLTSRTQSHLGYSRDETELLRYSREGTIDEGDWDRTYPARIELWFLPLSGGPQRKLIETEKSIYGWER